MRKFSGMLLVIVFALLLAACGGEDEGGDPTEEPTEAATSTEAAEETATDTATEAAATGGGTPASGAMPDTSTPASTAPPASVASPAASPVATPTAATPESGNVVRAAPDGAEGGTRSLSGTIILPGSDGQAFIFSDTGCVGLGEFSNVQAGRQVVIRDETGTIIGVTTLDDSGATDMCAWNFSVEVPESEFYSVSIPMVIEYVYTSEDIEQQNGEISLPLR